MKAEVGSDVLVPWVQVARRVLRRGLFYALVWLATVLVSFVPSGVQVIVHPGQQLRSYSYSMGAYLSRLGTYLGDVFLRGTLGECRYACPVTQIMARSLPVSAGLLIGALLVSLAAGIPLGYAVCSHRRGRGRKILQGLLYGASCIPDFLLGMGLMVCTILLARAGIPFLPVSGYGTAQYLVGPFILLCLLPTVLVSRLSSVAFDRVLAEDYIRTARGKGCSPRRVFFRHALLNVLRDVLSGVPKVLTLALSNLVVLEYLFHITGAAYFLIQAVGPQMLGFYTIYNPFQFDSVMIAGEILGFAAILLSVESLTSLVTAILDARAGGVQA